MPEAHETPSFELRRLSAKESAGNFENYDHGAFRVTYPANWEVMVDPNSSLTIYPKGGAYSTAVCYGKIISGFKPNRSAKQRDDAMRQLMSDIRNTNPELRPTGSPVNISVGGRAAKSFEMLGKSASPKMVSRLASGSGWSPYERRGTVLYMIFVARDEDFDSLPLASNF